ncbi:leucine-rich repeat domain-containing protein [Psychroserpens damuponensis]|uniref:leucine-rich repeat domain-containing protein n=1 Tax=Psychroserpens damuponensis TaxID=943936 RepID=UPI000694A2C5|nr:leucine-rich repeat domain-containing protein [Psychroserpens damuponensis]
MKKELLILMNFIAIATLNFGLNAQNVNIPDANFKAYLLGNSSININNDNEIQISEAASFTGLINCSNNGISNLTGIESFINLTALVCLGNNLSSIDVSQNTALIAINCSNNNLTSLDVSLNTALTSLFCIQNNISVLNVDQNTALQELYCSSNNLSAINLNQNTGLTSFECEQNNVNVLDLSNNPNLSYLNCQENNLTVMNMKNISTSTLQSSSFLAASNPNLTCIEVDNVAAATSNWTNIDPVSSFSTDCGSLVVGDTFVSDFITYEVTSLNPNTTKAIDYNEAGGTVVNMPGTVSFNGFTYSITSIGNQAFFQNGLTSVSIPNSVTIIDDAAFRGNSFTSFTIPNSVITIGNSAFRDNMLMTNITLGNNITSIGQEAFAFNDLQSLTIPDSVLTIGYGAFVQNTNLNNLILGNNLTSIDDLAFAYAFISNITIPASVTTIGANAFLNNNVLVDVTSLSTTPPIITTGTNDTFGSIANRGTINLHIPPNTTGAYVTDTGALWTDFMTVTEDALLGTSAFNISNAIKIITTLDYIKVVTSNGVILNQYEVYNISGAKITTGHVNNIPTTFLSSGIYLLKLEFNQGTITKKILIK